MSALQYLFLLAAVVIPPGLFVAYMARRERLREEAEEAEEERGSHGTAAE